MTDTAQKDSTVLWQQQEDGMPEPALLIEAYGDVIQITQEDQRINLNYRSVKELCSVLKSLKQP